MEAKSRPHLRVAPGHGVHELVPNELGNHPGSADDVFRSFAFDLYEDEVVVAEGAEGGGHELTVLPKVDQGGVQ